MLFIFIMNDSERILTSKSPCLGWRELQPRQGDPKKKIRSLSYIQLSFQKWADITIRIILHLQPPHFSFRLHNILPIFRTAPVVTQGLHPLTPTLLCVSMNSLLVLSLKNKKAQYRDRNNTQITCT